jgi:hypothetical protein
MTSPIASPQNVVAVIALSTATHGRVELSFSDWLLVAIPFCTVASVLVWGFLVLFYGPDLPETVLGPWVTGTTDGVETIELTTLRSTATDGAHVTSSPEHQLRLPSTRTTAAVRAAKATSRGRSGGSANVGEEGMLLISPDDEEEVLLISTDDRLHDFELGVGSARDAGGSGDEAGYLRDSDSRAWGGSSGSGTRRSIERAEGKRGRFDGVEYAGIAPMRRHRISHDHPTDVESSNFDDGSSTNSGHDGDRQHNNGKPDKPVAASTLDMAVISITIIGTVVSGLLARCAVWLLCLKLCLVEGKI